ncbi:hypothetical protein HPB50_008872 [Hyalomma asiaticum]|uniref:Uncharacterized protein n=1 Tax=Hyalomma asiaticum TaxID=266040 RepID=A0ACB7T6N5_HYAAI|nr:hypothetical protein HPB50_008872 [Hyalomma asiaticum]
MCIPLVGSGLRAFQSRKLADSLTATLNANDRICQAFAPTSIAEHHHKILKDKVVSPHTVTWFPARVYSYLKSLPNVNDAHSQARALTHRAGAGASSKSAVLHF